MSHRAPRHAAGHRSRTRPGRRVLLVAVAAVGAAGLVGAGVAVTDRGGSSPATATRASFARSLLHPRTRPLLGIVGFTGRLLGPERAAGVEVVTISVGWNRAEPHRGSFDLAYLRSVNRRIADAAADGLGVVVDPGIQYPADWVFALGGGTRFVDQYGDTFTGPADSGDRVANAVTDLSVRAAVGRYLRVLGQHLDLADVTAVRQGGGPLGELRYPGSTYAGHSDAFWAYDSSSQRDPALRTRPGSGTEAAAARFLRVYDRNLRSYADWMNARYRADFHRVTLLLLPGWGQRPGVAATEAASRLTLTKPEFGQGLDWADLLPSLPDRADTVAYTTYLDAPSLGSSRQNEDPADYLASLVGPLGMGLAGENTGRATVSALQLTLARAAALHLRLVCWFDEAALAGAGASGRPTFADLADVARSDLGS